MHFGQTLEAHQHAPWALYYLDYESLKEILDQDEQDATDFDTHDGSRSLEISTTSRWTLATRYSKSHPVTKEFLAFLQRQMEKILLFLLQEQGRIATSLANCRLHLSQAQTEDELGALNQSYQDAGRHLLGLVKFVELNVTGLRKIIKKHDKIMSTKIATRFWSANRNRLRGSQLVQPLLLQDDSMGALAWILESGMVELRDRLHHQRDDALLLRTAPQTIRKEHMRRSFVPAIPLVISHLDDDGSIESSIALDLSSKSVVPPPLAYAENSVAPPRPPPPESRGYTGHINSAPQTLRKEPVALPDIQLASAFAENGNNSEAVLPYLTTGAPPRPPPIANRSLTSHMSMYGNKRLQASTMRGHAFVPQEQILMQIQAARRRLKKSNEFARLLAVPLMITDISPEVETDEMEKEDYSSQETPPPPSSISNHLNLLSTFLYMTNYYIVAPTSASYAHKLGGDPAMAAMIIGMTPIAALFSTVLFSWWTSYSYKAALIFASSCSLVGNCFYAAGMPCDSLTLVMIGRLFNGFGSARSINRRYIADTFSREDRTAASAVFVTAGALGMAAGPAIASLLNLVASSDGLNPFWQVENAPGWLMALLWSVYLVGTIFCFRNPPKKEETPLLELTGEKKPLLTGNTGASRDTVAVIVSHASSPTSILRNVPVMTTFLIYFLLKLVLEGVLSSSAILTSFYFGWNSNLVGIYLACLGLCMLPANLCVAFLAKRYDDRELIMTMQVVLLAGCIGVMQYSPSYSAVQYVSASFVLFLSTNALEG
jgi:predicted MFS family arabinose efflux permease